MLSLLPNAACAPGTRPRTLTVLPRIHLRPPPSPASTTTVHDDDDAMAPARRRVSYIIPPPSEPVPRLQLPPHGASRTGAAGPLLIPAHTAHDVLGEPWPKWAQHPRHRLGVCCLALDAATQLVGRSAPGGILYSGGRDGLVISWDLDVPMKRRTQRYGVQEDGMRRSVGQWEIMTGWADEVAEDETEDAEEARSDGDILGDVQDSNGRRRRRRPRPGDEIPYEHQWETDLEAFQPGQVSTSLSVTWR